jgi:hypothetical protein
VLLDLVAAQLSLRAASLLSDFMPAAQAWRASRRRSRCPRSARAAALEQLELPDIFCSQSTCSGLPIDPIDAAEVHEVCDRKGHNRRRRPSALLDPALPDWRAAPR